MVSNMEKVLVVDCAGAFVIDDRKLCIERAFGSAGALLWGHCWAKFSDSFEWHTPMYTPDYLISQMAELGLTQEHFSG